MPSPESKLPVDPNVTVPPSVKRASEAADAIHAQAYGPGTGSQTPEPAATPAPATVAEALAPAVEAPAQTITPQPDPAPAQASPQPDPAPQPQALDPAVPLSRPEERAGVDPAGWEGRYYAMEGRFRQSQQTIGSLQQQMSELGEELVQTQRLLRLNPQERAQAQNPQQRQQQPAAPLLTQADHDTYGPELLDTIKRAALEAVSPALQTVEQQTRQVNQRFAQTAQQAVYADLAREVPNWKAINNDQRFKNWCRSQDVYSGQLRGKMLNEAFQAANAPRVVAFFKGFLSEEQATGQMPAPQPVPQQAPAPRQAAVSLDTLAAPGRAKPASGDTPGVAADKPVFTRAQITQFYSHAGRAAYAGREVQRDRDEQAIFLAQREGRVR